MTAPDAADNTRLLRAAAGPEPDSDAEKLLVDALYADLRHVAASMLRDERSDHTLQPTALVHEAYIRLVDVTVLRDGEREHFFSLAARAMRRALIDHARKRGAARRGGEWRRVHIDQHLVDDSGPSSDVLAVHEVLERFSALDPRAASVAELRLFGGLNTQEVAEILDVSVRTAANDWTTARAWISRELSRD